MASVIIEEEEERDGKSWSLDVSFDEGRTWEIVKRGPSCDSCKSHAREHFHKTDFGNINTILWYRIYAGYGWQLFAVSSNNTSWRMKWWDGDLKSRHQKMLEERH